MSRASAARRLVRRARDELPAPGDPRVLMQDLADEGLAGPEALEVLSRTTTAWVQLRDLELERRWQRGYGWFLARNVMVFGLVALVAAMGLGLARPVLDGALVGVGLFYLLCLALGALRLSGQARRRRAVLEAYGRDLSAYLDELDGGAA